MTQEEGGVQRQRFNQEEAIRAQVRWEPLLHGGEEVQTSSSLGPGGMERETDREGWLRG